MLDGCARETDDHEYRDSEESYEHAEPLVHLPSLAGLLLLVMSDNVVLPVCGQVDVEIHEVVGQQSEKAAQQGKVEQSGQDGVLEPEHGEGEGVQVVGVDSVQLVDGLLRPGQEAGGVDEGIEDVDPRQKMVGQVLTGLGDRLGQEDRLDLLQQSTINHDRRHFLTLPVPIYLLSIV